VLAHLYREGPSTPSEVSAAEHQRPQSLTRVFAELERAGLVSREPSPRDRRASLLTVTPRGAEALQRDMSQRDVWLAAAIAELGETEIELLRIAATVIDKLADATPAQQSPKAAA
jgi:DNA-binding MarR family transcriptional regulator